MRIGLVFVRAATVLLLAFACLLLVDALWALPPSGLRVRLPRPDVVFLAALFVSLSARGSFAGALGLAILLGWLADLRTGAPKGLHMATFAATSVLVGSASSRLLVSGALLTGVVAFVIALAHNLALVLLRASIAPSVGLSGLRLVAAQAIVTGFAAPSVFALLRRFDLRLTRDPRLLAGALAEGGKLGSAESGATL